MTTQRESSAASGAVQIPHLLGAQCDGDSEALGEFINHVYPELRTLAVCKMAQEGLEQTLQPTELVHEAWLRLARGGGLHCPDRAYFFAAAGEAMRRTLIENARRSKRLKRGGNFERVDLREADLAAPIPNDDFLAVDEALSRFAEAEPRAAELVNLLFFAELTQEQAAQKLGVSISTVERRWAFARAWLFRELQKSRNSEV